MTFRQKVEEAEKQRVHLPANLLEKEIFGVYGFFAVKENKKNFYVDIKDYFNFVLNDNFENKNLVTYSTTDKDHGRQCS